MRGGFGCLLCVLVFSISACVEDPMIKLTDSVENVVINATREELKQKYDYITFSGSGVSRVLKTIFLGLDVEKKLDKAEARKLLVDISMTLLKNINDVDFRVDLFIDSYPLDIKNIELALFISSSGNDVFYPDLGTVSLKNGVVQFWTFEKNKGGYRTLEEELFEETFRIALSTSN